MVIGDLPILPSLGEERLNSEIIFLSIAIAFKGTHYSLHTLCSVQAN